MQQSKNPLLSEQTVAQQESTVGQSIRDLALEGLIIETFNEFNFFLDEESDACVELEIDDCTDVLAMHSVAFEYLYRYFAESKGIQLSDDELIAQLIKIERFVSSLEGEFICDDCLEQMETEA